jgi:hypothetical protein
VSVALTVASAQRIAARVQSWREGARRISTREEDDGLGVACVRVGHGGTWTMFLGVFPILFVGFMLLDGFVQERYT